jgi:uncharacterized membrane protein YjfL (UPF0719 family)
MGDEASDRLDRHVLVLAIWTPAVLAAAALVQRGLTGGPWWIAAGFAALLAGFAGHVIANAVLHTRFTAGETALGMVAFALAAVAVGVGALVAPGIGAEVWLALALGLVALAVGVVLYLLIAFGPRRAFERFDVIRDNNPRPASRLPHRGGRR